jgi:hypothetical protein
MIGWCHGIIRRRDLTIGSHQYRFAAGAPRIGDFHAIGLGYGSVLVAQQIVRKIEFILERFVVTGRIDADPDDNGILVIEVLDSITEPVAFDGSPRCVGFRIPPEQNVFAGMIGQRNVVSVLVR